MLKRSTTELWHVGMVHRPLHEIVQRPLSDAGPVTWLPCPKSFSFIADPFGLLHEGVFTVLVEHLDYRIKRGTIDYYNYDSETWKLQSHGQALATPHHLSYPFLIRDGGEIYMLPESHSSGKVTLYRAVQFPDSWEPVATLLDLPAIDASVVFYEGHWWMFYALPGAHGRAMKELHVAHADALTGPWVQHTHNPVRTGLDSSRPGGTPFVNEGALYAPTQDCTRGYGGAINLLKITTLTPSDFAAEIVQHVSPQGLHAKFAQGLHTLSGDGGVTLIDVKCIQHCHSRRFINVQRRLRRLRKKLFF